MIDKQFDLCYPILRRKKEGCAVEQTKVQKLDQVLRVLVMVVFVCNIVALFFVPFSFMN